MSNEIREAVSYTRLTLALDIIEKITEGPAAGFHELGIVKHQIDLGDRLVARHSLKTEISCAHPMVPEDERNICWQAVELMREKFQIKDSLSIDIEKVIPVEGGLAGGSTNAATTLKLANEMWELGLTPEELIPLGRQLGQDVPFYFYGGTAFDSEATGQLTPVENNHEMVFLLVIPPFGVSTKAAYGGIDYTRIAQRTAETSQLMGALQGDDIKSVAALMHNDFELSVFPEYPKLKEIKDELLAGGALSAVMSGSGSTMVALVEDIAHAEELSKSFETTIISKSSPLLKKL